MTINNYNYQSTVDSHKRLQELAIFDEVLIRAHQESFLLRTLKKLHTQRKDLYKILRRFGSSAYELNILRDLEINPVFSVENLTRYYTSTGPQLSPVHSLQQPLLRRAITEDFMQSFLPRSLSLSHSHTFLYQKVSKIKKSYCNPYRIEIIKKQHLLGIKEEL